MFYNMTGSKLWLFRNPNPGCCELVYHIFYCMFLHCGRTQNYFMLDFMLGSGSKMHHSITCSGVPGIPRQGGGGGASDLDEHEQCQKISARFARKVVI